MEGSFLSKGGYLLPLSYPKEERLVSSLDIVAEAEIPSIQLQLDKRVMDTCARKGLSGVTVRNDKTIIKRLQARRGRR